MCIKELRCMPAACDSCIIVGNISFFLKFKVLFEIHRLILLLRVGPRDPFDP